MGFKMSDFSPSVQKLIREQVERQRQATPEAKKEDLIPPERKGMNKTEWRYANHLDALKAAGEIVAWMFEPFGMKLADKTYYHPDFIVWFPDNHCEIHEVKGFWQDDARAKIKIAAAKYPMFKFLAIKQGNNCWDVERF